MKFKTITFIFAMAFLAACGAKSEGNTDVKSAEINDTIVKVDAVETEPLTEDENTDLVADPIETEKQDVTEVQATEKKTETKKKTVKVIKTELTGSKWIMTELSLKAISSKKTKIYFIEFFEKDNRFTAYAGCNQMSGNYKLNGTSISFSDVMQTKMACNNMEDEQEMSSVLSDTRYFSIEEGKLKLMNAKKNVLAQFN